VSSPDNELIHHNTQPGYERLAGRKFASTRELIQFFFHYNRDAKFAGFKSMPRRHPDYSGFVQQQGIQFITLDRRDIFATAASFLTAIKHRTWRRDGGQPPQKLRYEPADERQLKVNLAYMAKGRLALMEPKGAIALYYEDLCRPEFSSAQLNEFFEHPITLKGAKAPVHTSDYVENDAEFRTAVETTWNWIRGQLPDDRRALLDSIPITG
jgi:LPS sulfotransferase NodH